MSRLIWMTSPGHKAIPRLLNQPVKINPGWFHVSRAVNRRFGPDSRAKEMAICVVILFPGPPPVPLESFVALLSGRIT